jgi:hypothetical protein
MVNACVSHILFIGIFPEKFNNIFQYKGGLNRSPTGGFRGATPAAAREYASTSPIPGITPRIVPGKYDRLFDPSTSFFEIGGTETLCVALGFSGKMSLAGAYCSNREHINLRKERFPDI